MCDPGGSLDDVAKDCRSSRASASAAAVEHELVERSAFDEDCVEAAPYRRERVVVRNHGRVDPGRNLVRRSIADSFNNGKQLDDVTQTARIGDIRCRDPADAFDRYVGSGDGNTKRNGRNDCGFGLRVVTLDIGGRVSLGITESLRFGQDLGVIGAVFGHGRKHVVGGAVNDAHDAVDRFTSERLLQRAHERDGASDRGFEQQLGVVRSGQIEELASVCCQQRLVTGHHRLTRTERLANPLSGELDGANEFDNEVDVISINNIARLIGEHRIADTWARFAEITHRDPGHGQVNPGQCCNVSSLFVDQSNQRTTNVPKAKKPNTHRLHFHGHETSESLPR